MTIAIEPKDHMAVAEQVDFNRSKSGLELPTSQLKGVTYGARILKIGESFDTKRAKVGDVVMYKTASQAFFRNGQSFLLIEDANVMGVITYDPEDIGAQPNETLKLPPKGSETKAEAKTDEAAAAP